VERTSKGIDIKELPIRVWTQSYKEQLEEWLVGTQKTAAFVKVCALVLFYLSWW
jgi:hypothetical protein